MLREVTKTAETVEQALEEGIRELGVDREQTGFEIIDMPTPKTLGLFGGTPAKVRVYVEEKEEEKAPEKAERELQEARPEPVLSQNPSPAAQRAAAFVKDVTDKMGMEAQVEIYDIEKGYELRLSGELRGLIGHRGETLDALQYLTSLVANRNSSPYERITINIDNYRQKRETNLVAMAEKNAKNALRTNRLFHLDPMNPYERRIVHTAVQEIKGAASWSVGNGIDRHVVIGPVSRKGETSGGHRSGRGGQRRRDGHSSRRDDHYEIKPRERRAPRPMITLDPDRVPRREVEDKPLYGKIEL